MAVYLYFQALVSQREVELGSQFEGLADRLSQITLILEMNGLSNDLLQVTDEE